MTREIVNKSPTRKTLVTGESLPAVETEARPIPLGYDEDGKPDAQIRAFAVLARNRSDSPVYIREGATADENVIDAGESFQIWEPDGVSDVQIRGENGGERVEFRTLEAHNDFSITDKIDAFARALSHFFGTSRRSTTIEGDVDIGTFSDTVTVDSIQSGTVDIGDFADTVEISDIAAASATFDVAGTVDVGQFGDTVTVSDIQAGTVDIGDFADTVTVDDIAGGEVNIADLDGNTLDLDADGNLVIGDIQSGTVDIGQFSDTITIDDITATSATFDVAGAVDVDQIGDTVTIDDISATSATFDVDGGVDVTGQSAFDLSVYDREGVDKLYTYDGLYEAATYNSNFGNYSTNYYNAKLFNPASHDGRLKRLHVRAYNGTIDPTMTYVELKIDRDSTGTWDIVNPRAAQNGEFALEFGGTDIEVGEYQPWGEVVWTWEPSDPPKFEEGDSVAVQVFNNEDSENSFGIEIEVQATEVVKR